MPRKPKPKNTLSAGERAAIYEAEQAQKKSRAKNDSDGQDAAAEIPSPTKNVVAEEKTPLPKPQHATLEVDFSIPVGRVKAMHGFCNGPVSYGADISNLFREIGVPQVRFAETDTALSAYAVDVSRIFKDTSRDPHDSSAYDFSYTDKYITAAYNAGARVIFRLGESVDLLRSGKAAAIPRDIDLFVEISANIVRHYNDYWADGYAFGIEYFEIWSIDRGQEIEEVCNLYARMASALKLIDSSLKVGGCGFDSASDIKEFVRYCRRKRAPIDFITVSSFSHDPLLLKNTLADVIPYIHNCGFPNTEIIIGAWNYIDEGSLGKLSLDRVLSGTDLPVCEARRDLFSSQQSVKGAAYALAFMISLGEVNEVSRACYYDAQPYISAWCGISDRFGNPQKPFYAFKAYGEVFRAGNRVYSTCRETEGFAHSGIYALAAEGENALYVLISSFDGCGIVDLRLDSIPENIYTADIYMLDGVKDMTLADSVAISGAKKRLLLNISRYGAALVKLY